MEALINQLLFLAVLLAPIVWCGNRICHPARRRLRTVVFFVFAVFFVPWAAMGIAYLFYQYDNTPPFNAFIFGGFLTLFFFLASAPHDPAPAQAVPAGSQGDRDGTAPPDGPETTAGGGLRRG